jgi:methyl-accepting chemotaxis protein
MKLPVSSGSFFFIAATIQIIHIFATLNLSNEMGIRKKISLGFVVIGTILFLSSVIAIFEFNRMKNSVTQLMNANINSINTSRMLMELTDEYNFILLSRVIVDSVITSEKIMHDDRFDKYINSIKSNFTSEAEVIIADSLATTYSEYLSVIRETRNIMSQDYESRKRWYENDLKPVYNNLRLYKKRLGLLTQAALADNTKQLQEGYYRSIMPGIIAVSAGIILVLLFNYFINLYFISPILLISKGIKNYKNFRKSYNVQFDNDDEIQDMNSEVKSIIDENKKLKSNTQ